MKIRFVRNCAAAGQHYAAGEVHEVQGDIARELVKLRRAIPLGDTVVEVREPAIESREPSYDPAEVEQARESIANLIANKPRRGRPPKV